MVAGTIRFYLDENVPVAVADQLRLQGIEVFTARELDLLRAEDEEHLARATEMDCVLCTRDFDFLRLAAKGVQHAGIVLGQMNLHHVGQWVRALILNHAAYTSDDMRNHVEYL